MEIQYLEMFGDGASRVEQSYFEDEVVCVCGITRKNSPM